MEKRKNTTLAGPDVPIFKVVIEQGRKGVGRSTGTHRAPGLVVGVSARVEPSSSDRSWWEEVEDSPTHLQLPRG